MNIFIALPIVDVYQHGEKYWEIQTWFGGCVSVIFAQRGKLHSPFLHKREIGEPIYI